MQRLHVQCCFDSASPPEGSIRNPEVEHMKKLVTRETPRRPKPIEDVDLSKVAGGGDPDIPLGPLP